MGSKPLQSSKNVATVLALSYELLRGKTGLRFHTLVEMRQDQRKPVLRLSGEPPHDPNQLSAPPVKDYNQLTPDEAKETHPICAEKIIISFKT